MTEPEAPRAAQRAHENAETPEEEYDEERAPAAKQAHDNREKADRSSTPPDQ
ncbi:hypothetical protein [Actinomycetospora straminea]|uniref:Uncharacterized protein n=1 Tax=Actinomycetospora straminea TaxID=663607 RepID=A0ABP9EP27_9PSEU|nr:hypothetical protein [Actinomycetospora straminea]MDD7933137.1 hypothetical protein [Actinomycetospora straminea]